MITHLLTQGSDAWHAYRANYFNASDAPAMLGLSPYQTRTELLDRLHSGISKEVDSATQARFDEGHRFEALARPLAEEIIGEDVYPVTGNNGIYSASFDGITLDEVICFEHKRLNNDIRFCVNANDLSIGYRIQMEQQLMVAGAEKCLFMATNWEGDNCIENVHFYYLPDLKLRKKIIDGWSQFEKDLANHVMVEVIEKPKANAIMALPSLNIQINGEVLQSNLPAVQESITTFIANIKTELVTDEDFSNAEAAIIFCKEAESSLENAKKSALSQTASIDELMRTIDFIKEQLRGKRLILDKAVTTEKDKRKLEIINNARELFYKYINENSTPQLAMIAPDFAGAIKGKKTLSSMKSAVNDLLAQGKIDVDKWVVIINKNQALFDSVAINHKFLFVDLPSLIQNESELFELKVKDRIAKYELEQKEIQAQKELVENVAMQKESTQVERVIFPTNTVVSPKELARELATIGRATIGLAGSSIPSLEEIIGCLSSSFNVSKEVAAEWLNFYFNERN